ncbi:hypothetical protein [Longispora albida]|uniref:hypothetical protein n=1 Tax=Longispora albida TaxID=203523 RepID=UPI00036B0493|nr:hypothetical protein [Longispora albida]
MDTVPTELSAGLNKLREAAGGPSFTELVRRITRARAARGLPRSECEPGRTTVYDCFRPGRRRLDGELVADIIRALGGTDAEAAYWREFCHRSQVPAPRSGTPFPSVEPGSCPVSRVVAQLATAVMSLRKGGLVNLVGPVGSGKSWIIEASQLPWYVTVIDDADEVPAGVLCAELAASPREAGSLGGLGCRVVVAVTRFPVRARRDWPVDVPTAVVRVPAWSDQEVREFARKQGITEQEQLDVVAGLSGGVPLIADRLCRSLHAGQSAEHPGALADAASTEILRRLGQQPGLLARLATMGAADAELLPPGEYEELAALSIVSRTRLGLAVQEPYRTLFDLVHRWRSPQSHRRTVVATLRHRRALLVTSPPGEPPSGLVEQALWLSGDPVIRETLFPARAAQPHVRAAVPSDAEDILRFTRDWANRGGLHLRRSERTVASWLASDPSGFRVVVNADGRTSGAISALPLTGQNIGVIEPLLQRGGDRFAGTGGIFVGMSYCEEGPAHAALLRDLLGVGVATGQVVASTFWPAYQRLCRALGFQYHGDSVDNVYGSARPLEVHAHKFTRAELPGWLDRLAGLGLDTGPDQWLVTHVRDALDSMHEPDLLARSPLLASPATPVPGALRRRLVDAIGSLDASPVTELAEAGRLLRLRYLDRRCNAAAARLLCVSRATYYRRLRQAVAAVARELLVAW